MLEKASVKLVRDSERIDKERHNEEEPRKLVLRVIYAREKRNYSIGCDIKLTQAAFIAGRTNAAREAIEKGKHALEIAEGIIDEMGNSFTFQAFRAEYQRQLYGNKKDRASFSTIADDYIAKLNDESKPNYRTAVNALKAYSPKLKISEITPAFMNGFYRHLLTDKSENTARIYLREIKAIYNSAVKQNLTRDTKPFASIVLISKSREKKIIPTEEFYAFLSAKPTTKSEKIGYDFFKLIFLLNGPNFIDIITLKNRDIDSYHGTISYTRHKTKKRGGDVTTVKLPDEAKDILNKYGRIDLSRPDSYILKYLDDSFSTKTIMNTKRRILDMVNDGIDDICTRIKIPKFTTYNIRHTAASFLRDSKMTTEQIQKLLGHASPRTTEIYLGSLSQGVVEQASSILQQKLSKRSGNE